MCCEPIFDCDFWLPLNPVFLNFLCISCTRMLAILSIWLSFDGPFVLIPCPLAVFEYCWYCLPCECYMVILTLCLLS
jgi:hypothetical protein